MGAFDPLILLLLLCFYLWAMSSSVQVQGQHSSFTIWSFSRPEMLLKPYDWTYLRVDVPIWFSSITMTFTSSADIDKVQLKKIPKRMLPVICFNQGRLPLPDFSDSYLQSLLSNFNSTGTFDGSQYLPDMEQCIPFQQNFSLTLTKDKVSPGLWYFGFFNGLGPERTQSKMINRGHSYSLSASINVEGCASSTNWGAYCNNTIDMISCPQIFNYKDQRTLLENNYDLKTGNNLEASSLPVEKMFSCNNLIKPCFGKGEIKFYSFHITVPVIQFRITAADLVMNQSAASSSSVGFDEIIILCYARYNAMPLSSLPDHSADISRVPLIIGSPKVGLWYVALQVLNFSHVPLCFTLEWKLYQCDNGKAGQNCTWESHVLQRVIRKGSIVPLESSYLPEREFGSLEDTYFHLNHLLSKFYIDNAAWTFFFLEVPYGAAGSHLHVQLIAENSIGYEIYTRYGGAASIDNWDFYVNFTSKSNGTMLVTSNDLSKGKIEFYLFNVKEGIWSFGVRHTNDIGEHQSSMSISLDGCPKDCYSNGQCRYSVDESGLKIFSYCSCDLNHGGFDCSIELVSLREHFWHSIFLVLSNGAAILPAYWSLRQKDFSEWVLFTSSGISSGLYHACDVGSWCPLSFHALQFMDFWLSFMAVVSNFVYMATFDEASKRAIHTAVAIVTALLAVSGATRSKNIFIVIAIGTMGLLVGWLLEFYGANKYLWPPRFEFDMSSSWQVIKRWCLKLFATFLKRFRLPFIFLGFVGLALAGTSWMLETSSTYWFWHSFWHISIYTASFFFLCSVRTRMDGHQMSEYELTRQNSSSRD